MAAGALRTGNAGVPPGPRRAVAAVLIVVALIAETDRQERRLTAEARAARATAAAADVEMARQRLSEAAVMVCIADRAEQEASRGYWAANWDFRKRQIAAASGWLAPAGRAKEIGCVTGAAAARGAASAAAGPPGPSTGYPAN